MENETRNSQDGTVQRAAQIAATPGGFAPGNGGAGSSVPGFLASLNAPGHSGTMPVSASAPIGAGTDADPVRTMFPFILGEDALGDPSCFLVVEGNPPILSF